MGVEVLTDIYPVDARGTIVAMEGVSPASGVTAAESVNDDVVLVEFPHSPSWAVIPVILGGGKGGPPLLP